MFALENNSRRDETVGITKYWNYLVCMGGWFRWKSFAKWYHENDVKNAQSLQQNSIPMRNTYPFHSKRRNFIVLLDVQYMTWIRHTKGEWYQREVACIVRALTYFLQKKLFEVRLGTRDTEMFMKYFFLCICLPDSNENHLSIFYINFNSPWFITKNCCSLIKKEIFRLFNDLTHSVSFDLKTVQ